MAAPLAAGAVAAAGGSSTVRWLLGSVVGLPVVLVVMLLLIVSAGAAVETNAGPGLPGILRAGSVPAAYEPLVLRASRTCPGITAPLLAAQLEAESGWDPGARSPVGAQGLAQFMPGTWASEGTDGDGDGLANPFNPADAIASQASFMCALLKAVAGDDRLSGDAIDLALAAYNAGLGAVRLHGGVPPYPETETYVRRIRALVATYADPGGTAPGAGPPGSWVRPVLHGPITSHFGQRWGRLHAGVDFGTPIGTPVYAASSGTVVAAGAAGGYGQWIKLGHAGGTTSVYGHVSSWTVTVGQPVAVGQLIGYSGNEGRSTGPHLHFEVRPDDRPVDPVAFYAAHGVDLS